MEAQHRGSEAESPHLLLPEQAGELAARLRGELSRVVLGQEDAKTGLVLALLSRQHAYVEGPPGCGKSLLASTLATASGCRSVVIPFHRDLREHDLLGDTILRRSKSERGERLRRDLSPGPLLESELALLEDLPRAPGEALGPLLRILGDRRALDLDLPLESAIATGPLLHDESPVDPLEPSQLDRFAVQLRLEGLLYSSRFREAGGLVAKVCAQASPHGLPPGRTVLQPGERAALQSFTSQLHVPSEVRAAYAQLLDRLPRRGSDAAALLSDRTFSTSALGLFRAHATLRGAPRVERRDLQALRFMVANRLPEDLKEQLEELLDELLEEPSPLPTSMTLLEQQVPAEELLGDGGEPAEQTAQIDSVLDDGATAPDQPEAQQATESASVERLLKALVGRIDGGRVDPDSDPGGQPRSYRPLKHLDELFDSDPVETLLFVEGRLPGEPRTFDRKRKNAGGAIVILRDISASMAGRLALWAGEVVLGVVSVAAQRRMRVGYVEFHHNALPHERADRLLHRSYAHLRKLARETRTFGQTNYEAPLRVALEGLRGRFGRNRHIVMLTDGLPIVGDTSVKKERSLAQRLGVSLHTVFLGDGTCPSVLDKISLETDGLRFHARPGGMGLRLEERGDLGRPS